ncbi:hypothetical protein NIBR502772_10935 [Pseudarthrobacter sp. NIBRBAC000502772]|uniref:hypothetical protein n=1 Tax=Pseudarthrobacter sp. NIBRBAC000502772 TaxID=2590775 RepID=UPI001130FB02|nr:hypothetical protein [Pseudarthrobacter sp. NIBRBAC000502772]QDG66656.1 hypothetical protein NIBR502772_10935 [Pseudarthrobacter sp. NIBRBAC000502772]
MTTANRAVWRPTMATALVSISLVGYSLLGSGPDPTTADADGITAFRPTSAEGPFPVASVTDGDTIRVTINGKSTGSSISTDATQGDLNSLNHD